MKKFTVSIQGYGHEITIGSVTEEQKEILSNEEKDLIDIVNEDLDDYGGYHEIDDQYHRWGAVESYTITIEDEDGNVVFEVDENGLYEHDTEDFELVESIDIYDQINQDLDLLVTVAHEKGSFFMGDFEAEEFDLTKLKITIDTDIVACDYTFSDTISGVYYDGEEIDNYGGDTSGKSFDAYKNF
jgi:hypothetical protein